MKRKASGRAVYEKPAKFCKQSTQATIVGVLELTKEKTVQKTPFEPLRLGSFRQRKAPSWLSSYVTSSTSKETAQPSTLEVPPLAKTKSKTEKADAKKESEYKVDGVTSLRKQNTVKIADSSNSSSETKPTVKTPSKLPSLSKRKSTAILLSKSGSKSKNSSSNDQSTSKLIITKNDTVSLKSSLSSKQVKNLKNLETLAGCSDKSFKVDANNSNVVEITNTNDIVKGESNLDVQEACTPEEMGKPTMLEVVICISTSGAMRDFLEILQDKTREMVWRLQSLIPNLRIGVFAHTQGGIHDDKVGSRSSAIDHNYIRTGGHSGTKWLDLGATYSQICAFVGSLEPEATVYPDYVQDNLEMALWKLQRCMSWSSCSYRTVVMLGRGRPNRTSFYLQREHWRGWIRSALEISKKTDIPVIDWELEAKLLAQMGIHVFTVQAVPRFPTAEEEEDEGSTFFRRVAEITNGQNIRLNDASKLIDILVGVCCACYGPDLLQEHRDLLRDENDGVVPEQLKDIFISLQLHSKRRSLLTIPSVIGDLSLVRRQLDKVESNGNMSGSEEEMSEEEERLEEKEAAVKLQDPVVTSTDTLASADLKAGTSKPRAKSSAASNKKVKATKTLNLGSKKLLDKKKKSAPVPKRNKIGGKPLDKSAIKAKLQKSAIKAKSEKSTVKAKLEKSAVKAKVKPNIGQGTSKSVKSIDKNASPDKKKKLTSLQKQAKGIVKKSQGAITKVGLIPKSKPKPGKLKAATKNDSKRSKTTKATKGKEVGKLLKVKKSKSVPARLSSNVSNAKS